MSTLNSAEYEAEEYPKYGGDEPVHFRISCAGCFVLPIVGELFECAECENMRLCRKCFFLEKVLVAAVNILLGTTTA